MRTTRSRVLPRSTAAAAVPIALAFFLALLGSCDKPGPTEAVNRTLTVELSGYGKGSVASEPAGIDCSPGGGTCTATLPQGTRVTLTPTPDARSAFGGWSQACTGTAPCALTLNEDAKVGAGFDNPRLVVKEIGPAGGTVTSLDEQLTLTVPAGALSSTVPITIERLEENEQVPEFAELEVDAAYRLGPAGQTFAVPVQISMRSEQRLRVSGDTLSLQAELVFISSDGAVELLDSLVTEAALDGSVTVTGWTSHFTTLGKPEAGFVAQAVVPENVLIGIEAQISAGIRQQVRPNVSIANPTMQVRTQQAIQLIGREQGESRPITESATILCSSEVIERVDVQKRGQVSVSYGSRTANGVISILTRRNVACVPGNGPPGGRPTLSRVGLPFVDEPVLGEIRSVFWSQNAWVGVGEYDGYGRNLVRTEPATGGEAKYGAVTGWRGFPPPPTEAVHVRNGYVAVGGQFGFAGGMLGATEYMVRDLPGLTAGGWVTDIGANAWGRAAVGYCAFNDPCAWWNTSDGWILDRIPARSTGERLSLTMLEGVEPWFAVSGLGIPDNSRGGIFFRGPGGWSHIPTGLGIPRGASQAGENLYVVARSNTDVGNLWNIDLRKMEPLGFTTLRDVFLDNVTALDMGGQHTILAGGSMSGQAKTTRLWLKRGDSDSVSVYIPGGKTSNLYSGLDAGEIIARYVRRNPANDLKEDVRVRIPASGEWTVNTTPFANIPFNGPVAFGLRSVSSGEDILVGGDDGWRGIKTGDTWRFSKGAANGNDRTIRDVWDGRGLKFALGDLGRIEVRNPPPPPPPSSRQMSTGLSLAANDGSGWTRMPNPAEDAGVDLYAIHGGGPDDVYAVGDRGMVLHFDGTAWRQVSVGLGGTATVLAVRSLARDNVYIGGVSSGAPFIRHFDGTAWRPVTLPALQPGGDAVIGIWASGPNDLWAVTQAGAILRFNGTSWTSDNYQTMASLPGGRRFPTGLAGSGPNDVFVVAEGAPGRVTSVVLQFDGTGWTKVHEDLDHRLLAIDVAPNGEVWVVGSDGLVLRGTR